MDQQQGRVTNVRIHEVVVSISTVSDGFGAAKEDDVVMELVGAINATNASVRKTIELGIENGYFVRDGVWLRLSDVATEAGLSKRIEEIAARLKSYEAHRNDPYAYFPGEISQVRELCEEAPRDIDFLLRLLAFRAAYSAKS